jgi:hypothetical protein
LHRRFVTLGIAFAPLLLAGMVGIFLVSTYIRTVRSIEGAGLGVGVEMARNFDASQLESSSIDLVLGTVAARVGYFDFSAEVMAHRQEYSSVLNLRTYGRSIVDNLLTPGVDFYDQPKIANSLLFVYSNLGTPSKQMASEHYQSDQLGIYGEFYALAGWTSLPLLFAVAFMFRRVYGSVYSRNPFVLTVSRAVVLFAFTKLIDSFGIDWVIADTLPMIAAIFIYGFFFASRRVRLSQLSVPGKADA